MFERYIARSVKGRRLTAPVVTLRKLGRMVAIVFNSAATDLLNGYDFLGLTYDTESSQMALILLKERETLGDAKISRRRDGNWAQICATGFVRMFHILNAYSLPTCFTIRQNDRVIYLDALVRTGVQNADG